MRICLEQERLFVEGDDGKELALLEASYELGTPFTVKASTANSRTAARVSRGSRSGASSRGATSLVAGASTTAVYYEDLGFPKLTLARNADDCYFQAGVQLPALRERAEPAGGHAEVRISNLQLEHWP